MLLGFTYASRVAVEAWGQWFRDSIGVGPDRTFFEVPMIGGLAKMGRWFIDRGMRKGTPAALHENVITVYANTGDWKKRLAVSSRNDKDAFLIVLDRDGVVRWLHHGPFDAARAEELTALWTDLHRSAISTRVRQPSETDAQSGDSGVQPREREDGVDIGSAFDRAISGR